MDICPKCWYCVFPKGDFHMSVIEDLYHGTLYPAERIIPKTKRYQESKQEAIRLSEELQNQLSTEQFELFETYCNATAVMADEMYCESFRQGVVLGAKLWRELQSDVESE